MHVYYKFGLFLIFILSVSQSYSKAIPTSAQNNNADYDQYDDYDDYYDDDKSTQSPASTTRKPPGKPLLAELFDSALSESNQSLDSALDLPKRSNEPSRCPTACMCRDDNKIVNCSNMDLTAVPKPLPSSAVTLDLSYNKISELPPDIFSNNTNLKEINLNGNLLTHIDKEVFGPLFKLERLSLADNKLTEIPQDTFSDASELRTLNLSNNSIVLPKEGSFLHQPALNELLLRNCSLTEIYDETFGNLSSLKTLRMDGNYFSKKINTKAFEPLKDLIKLKLPELEQDNIQELCNVLKSIDNISLKRFDISCYELVSGNSFNESLIFATDPPFVKPPKPAKSVPKTEVTKSPAAVQPVETNIKPAVMTYTNEQQQTSNVTDGASEIAAAMGALSTELTMITATTTTTEKAYQVPISQEAINYTLISIIIIAVIGLIIGFICRKDVGGIKTKCCRTRKPPPRDQVRPAEEIPLNKIG